MKAPVLILAATTVGLALTSTYLLQEVKMERKRTHAEATVRRGLEARVEELERLHSALESGSAPEPAVLPSARRSAPPPPLDGSDPALEPTRRR